MTDEERAVLREEIEGLTIRQARARAETATETLRVLAELGITGAPIVARAFSPDGFRAPTPVQPFPCRQCGRAGPIQPNEPGGAECIACGNPTPLNGARMSNKGPVGLSAEERARKLELPAFDERGEPIS